MDDLDDAARPHLADALDAVAHVLGVTELTEAQEEGGSGGGEDKPSGGGPNGIPGWNDTDNPPPGHFDQYLDDLDDAAEDPDWPEGWSNRGTDGEDGATTGARCA